MLREAQQSRSRRTPQQPIPATACQGFPSSVSDRFPRKHPLWQTNRHPPPYAVILSGVNASRSAAVTQSKDPTATDPGNSVSGSSFIGLRSLPPQTPFVANKPPSAALRCHPERSECFAKRSSHAVEGPRSNRSRQQRVREFLHRSPIASPANTICAPHFSARSSHLGFFDSIKAIFFALIHPFNCFSRPMAL